MLSAACWGCMLSVDLEVWTTWVSVGSRLRGQDTVCIHMRSILSGIGLSSGDGDGVGCKLTRAKFIIDFQFPTVIAQLVPGQLDVISIDSSAVRSANPTRRMDYYRDDNRSLFLFFFSFLSFSPVSRGRPWKTMALSL